MVFISSMRAPVSDKPYWVSNRSNVACCPSRYPFTRSGVWLSQCSLGSPLFLIFKAALNPSRHALSFCCCCGVSFSMCSVYHILFVFVNVVVNCCLCNC